MKKKYNYIFNSVDTDKVEKILPKVKTSTTIQIDLKKESKKKHKKGFGKKARKNRKRKTIRSYKMYMLSTLWIARKNKYWQEHGRFCVACGGTYKVTLHHAYYSNCYGQEPNTEVFAFCENCHSQFHKQYKLKKDMRNETNQFINDIQSNKYNELLESY